ncbi:hypothetical protein A2U01_0101083 [Trifolium medium]|uniref:Uncharacterized protein n=1 Tax=Trifolium medium TaxID=97028 RepID=A0A392UXG3_9FABA|nr:hypothetical protein [Trifolium medium]
MTGRLLDHTSLTKAEGIDVMMNLLGADASDAVYEV